MMKSQTKGFKIQSKLPAEKQAGGEGEYEERGFPSDLF